MFGEYTIQSIISSIWYIKMKNYLIDSKHCYSIYDFEIFIQIF